MAHGTEGQWPKGPGVVFPPPLLFVAGGLLGWAVHRYGVPVPIWPPGVAGPIATVALGVFGAGLVLAYWEYEAYCRRVKRFV